MPAVARITDIGSYHGPFPNTEVIEGSSNCDINSLGAHRVGDALAPHMHSRHLAKGSSTCDVNSRPLGYITCPVDCGGFIITGSSNTGVD